MTESELREVEFIAEDIDTLCDMTLRKAKEFAGEYTLMKCGRPDKKFTEGVLDLIKIRLTLRLKKEIFSNDN